MLKLSKLSPTKAILAGFCAIILLGTLLLCLPFATREPETTSPLDALFTATSATCVTGLVRFDTYTHWTLFGQLVILTLIQIGGMGFMTVAISLVSLTKRKIGLNQRVIMQESVAAPQVGGIVRMTKFILLGTFIFEGLGALLLCFHFCPQLGFWRGLYFSVFHSISAFCNAGFDLMGSIQPMSSLTTLYDNAYVSTIILSLIFIGGLGFFVWSDLVHCRFHFRKFKLHTKVVLTVSLLLCLCGAVLLLLFEQGGTVYADKSFGEQVLLSFFQSVAPRTAGFNTAPLEAMTQPSLLLIICLMLIGGSPGSTAGGLKTTTFAVSLLSVFTTFRRRKSVECFKRRIDDEVVRTAFCVMILYLLLSLVCTLVISSVENMPVLTALFEVASAIGTVGLSLGVTPGLGVVSQILLILLMIFGRAGSLTILLAFTSARQTSPSQLPTEKLQVG